MGTIIAHRERGKTMIFPNCRVVKRKRLSIQFRGKKFRGAHVHSIVKKKRLKDEIRKRVSRAMV